MYSLPKTKKPVHPENLTGQAGFLFHKVVEAAGVDFVQNNLHHFPSNPLNSLGHSQGRFSVRTMNSYKKLDGLSSH